MSGIYLTKFGAFTPTGNNSKMVTTMAATEVARLMGHPYLLDKKHQPLVTSYVSYFKEDIPAIERMSIMASKTLEETWSGIENIQGQIPVVLGIPPERPGLPCEGMPYKYQDKFLEWTRAGLGSISRNFKIELIEEEQTAFALALQKGIEKIKSGDTDICIIGGTDSYFEHETLEWLENEGKLQTSYNPYGFIPGEGSCTCVLTNDYGLKKYNLTPACELCGIGTAREENPERTTGKALIKATELALSDIDGSEMITGIYNDINGERYRSDDIGFSASGLKAGRKFADEAEPESLSDLWGDTGAATGGLLMLQACFAAKINHGKGKYSIIWTSSQSGMRTAVLLSGLK